MRPTHVTALVRRMLVLTAMLSLIGLYFVFEASVAQGYQLFGDQFHFIKHQAAWLLVGLCGMLCATRVPLILWQKISPILFCLSILLLLLVFVPGLGKSVNGAQRWILVFGVTLQPVEVLKFSIASFFASWLPRHQKLAPFLFLTLLPTGLLLLQPDLGSALLVLSITFGMYFLSGVPYRLFLLLGGIGVVGILMLILSSPYRLQRMTSFLNPESDPLGASFHIRQITLALGNGGLFGQGLGQSRQKYAYIPEASTDSIFAIIAEEVGFIGSLFILSLFGFFLLTAAAIVKQVPAHTFTSLFGGGLVLWLSSQVLLNLAAITALVPLTGVPLPFFSYGGSSLVMILFVVGVLIRTSQETHSERAQV